MLMNTLSVTISTIALVLLKGQCVGIEGQFKAAQVLSLVNKTVKCMFLAIMFCVILMPLVCLKLALYAGIMFNALACLLCLNLRMPA